MSFPLEISVTVDSTLTRTIALNSGFSVLVGPNGAGKTHFLRALRDPLHQHTNDRLVRFLPAGRISAVEPYRSDVDGYRGAAPDYEGARYGNKDASSRRHRMESVMGDFQTLAVRPDVQLKIQARLRKIFKRELIVDWDERGLQISFCHLASSDQPYPSAREASGLLQLVGLMAGLYDEEVGALLIDEPEVSLHPQLQAFLLKEMRFASGDPANGKKIIVIATHSTEMIRITTPEDLCSLIFCYDSGSQPVQLAPDTEELKNTKLRAFIRHIRHEHKLSLFSKRPLLVEGPSDVTICSALAERADIHLEAAGSQFLPIVGKGQMPVVAKVLRLLGKEPVILADVDAIADGTDLINQLLDHNMEADRSASKHGFRSAIEMANLIIKDFHSLVKNNWSDISPSAVQHSYWVNGNDCDELKAKRRSALCIVLTADGLQLQELGSAWEGIADRLGTLLDLLEAAGIFILRKGTIESYYLCANNSTSRGKPAAAAEEAEVLALCEKISVEVAYADIYRCLRFASAIEEVSESEAVQELTLAAVAPIIGRMQDGTRTHDPNVIAKSLLGNLSRIFDMKCENGTLTVNLNSTILSVSGFPLTIHRDDDVVRKIRDSLKIDT